MTTASTDTINTPSSLLCSRWLEKLLVQVPRHGWSEHAARLAAQDAGLSEGEQALAAPGGVHDLMEAFFDTAEADARAAILAADLEALRMHERVALGVRAFLEALEPNHEAVRRASAHAFLPYRAGDAAQRCWSVADTIWTAVGDTSDDHNFYTKRALLASVLPPIIMHWTREPDEESLDAFIAARLRNAMDFGRAGGRIVGPVIDLFTRRRAKDA